MRILTWSTYAVSENVCCAYLMDLLQSGSEKVLHKQVGVSQHGEWLLVTRNSVTGATRNWLDWNFWQQKLETEMDRDDPALIPNAWPRAQKPALIKIPKYSVNFQSNTSQNSNMTPSYESRYLNTALRSWIVAWRERAEGSVLLGAAPLGPLFAPATELVFSVRISRTLW